jgi:hypothetical protein
MTATSGKIGGLEIADNGIYYGDEKDGLYIQNSLISSSYYISDVYPMGPNVSLQGRYDISHYSAINIQKSRIVLYDNWIEGAFIFGSVENYSVFKYRVYPLFEIHDSAPTGTLIQGTNTTTNSSTSNSSSDNVMTLCIYYGYYIQPEYDSDGNVIRTTYLQTNGELKIIDGTIEGMMTAAKNGTTFYVLV